MKEKKEIEELLPQIMISPSSINTFHKCPRSYFYNYIAGLKTIPNIHLIKGTIVHEVLEHFFVKYPKIDLKEHIEELFSKSWDKHLEEVKTLELKPDEFFTAKQDCTNMLHAYLHSFQIKIDNLIASGKANNEGHAFNLMKPKFKEVLVQDEDLHCKGYIDRVNKDFDGNITLGDYKTSSKYGLGLPMDYKRQMAIYSLLYKNQEGVDADFVAVDFLRYGDTYFLEVTSSL